MIVLDVVALLVLGTIVASLVWSRPYFGVVIAIPLVVFNDLIVQILGAGATTLLFGALKDALLAFMVAIAVLKGRPGDRRLERVVLLVALLPLALIAMTPSLAQGLYGVRNSYLPMLWVFAVPRLLHAGGVRRVLTSIVWTGQAAAAVAIFTHAKGLAWLYELGVLPAAAGEPFPFQYFTSNSVVPRAFSPLISPNELSLVLVTVIAVAWLRKQETAVMFRVLPVVLPATALLLTRSRSGMLGLVVLAGFLVIRRIPVNQGLIRRGVVFLGAGLALTALALYLSRPEAGLLADPSFQGHAASIPETLGRAISHPLGYGPGTVGPRAIRYTDNPILTESFVLLVLLEAGVVVLAAYLLMLKRIVGHLGVMSRSRLSALGVAVLAGSSVNQLVLPSMQSTSAATVVWIAVGASLAATRLARQNVETSSIPTAYTTNPPTAVGTNGNVFGART